MNKVSVATYVNTLHGKGIWCGVSDAIYSALLYQFIEFVCDFRHNINLLRTFPATRLSWRNRASCWIHKSYKKGDIYGSVIDFGALAQISQCIRYRRQCRGIPLLYLKSVQIRLKGLRGFMSVDVLSHDMWCGAVCCERQSNFLRYSPESPIHDDSLNMLRIG